MTVAARRKRDRLQSLDADKRVWWGQNGPRNTGLSAVLFTKRLSPWSVELRRALLIRSPWAARPLAAVPLQVDELNPVEGKFVKSEGISLGAVVGLHKGWPEEPVA